MTNIIFAKKGIFVGLMSLLLYSAGALAQAQDNTKTSKEAVPFRPFSIGVGTNFPLRLDNPPGDEGYYPLWIGAQYAVNDKIGVGLRYGYYEHGYDPNGDDPYSVVVRRSHLIALQGDYFFVNRWPWRLSAGVGLVSYHDWEDKLFTAPVLGIAPRVRFQWKLIELGLAYYFTFDSKLPNDLAIGFGLQLGNVTAIKPRYTFKPFSVGLGIVTGVAATSRGTMISPLWIEPQSTVPYSKVGVGIRVEFIGALFGYGFLIVSWQGDYFFVNAYPYRISIGSGIGIYGDEGTSLGIAPRMRFQWYVFELGLSAHLNRYTFFAVNLGLQIYGKERR